MRRGQSAIEFVILVSFMLIVFFGFFVIIQGRIIDLTHQQDILFLKEANNIVLSEVELASVAAPDFQHTFVVPNSAANVFEINITDRREIVSSYMDLEYVNFFSSNVSGHLNALTKNNTVYQTDGIIIFPNQTQIINYTYAGISINVNPEICFVADNLTQCNNRSLISADMEVLCFQYFGLC